MNFLENDDVAQVLQEGCGIVDTRNAESFSAGFIKGAIFVPFNEQFINRLNDLISEGSDWIFVVTEENFPTVFRTLRASGFSNIKGFTGGNFETWQNSGLPVDMLIAIEADEFAADYRFDEFYLIDVRSKTAFDAEHAEHAEHIALHDLENLLMDIDANASYYVYGNTPEDALAAGSLFKRAGFQRVRAVAANIDSIRQTGVPWYVQKKKDTTAK
jgi:rhodanese-related sulfurtransferase